MAWSAPMPLTISRPLGWEYFKWTHTAHARTEPVLPVKEPSEHAPQVLSQRGKRLPKHSYEGHIPLLLVFLLGGPRTREDIQREFTLGRWQTSHVIYKAALRGLVRNERRPSQSWVTHLTDVGREQAEALAVRP